MSDRLHPVATERLVAWVFTELEANNSILGVPRELFFIPSPDDRFRTELFGHPLETPIGVAAGPHSQLAPNIIAAWLCGARVIELKTVQTLEAIHVPKPCIDMQDEGYNVEWSQELELDQSLDEYLRAVVLVRALHRTLGFSGDAPGVVFNLSVGYDLSGLLQPNMQRFLAAATEATDRLAAHLESAARFDSALRNLPLPRQLADSVTVSTMHGCPPSEIGDIARHLMEVWKLHTSIKLNPTLLGADTVRWILHDRLGYHHITVPESAFEHDPTFSQAVTLIRELVEVADRCGVQFGLKLANTLEVRHHGDLFDPGQDTMYLSGRPLHALVVQLAHRLNEALDGRVPLSFAGGADAFNVSDLLAAGLFPVTACSDLLRPPGYLRLGQYLEEITHAMAAVGARSIEQLVTGRAAARAERFRQTPLQAAARENLARYAERVLDAPELRRDRFHRTDTKTVRSLGPFDCTEAPCTDRCPVDQRVPRYMRLVRAGRFADAAAVARDDNPLAAILGRACHHPCELPCLRTHLDEPLAIREIKRFVMGHETPHSGPVPDRRSEPRVAVVGAGPCGLSAASRLARSGVPVTVFEARPTSGGMVSGTIPGYRAAQQVIDQDLEWIEALGVEVRHGQEIGRTLTLQGLREQGFGPVVVAVGARLGIRLGIEGEDADGVWDGLDFLRAAREGTAGPIEGRVGIVGGGDAAIDCARTARRLGAREVLILYRRSVDEMPAQAEEVRALSEEGIVVCERLAPLSVLAPTGKVETVVCAATTPGEPDSDGRHRPVVVPDSELEVPLDRLIVAIGQRADLSVFGDQRVKVNDAGFLEVRPTTHETSLESVYAGGDLVGSGPATIVEACGHGLRIAEAILERIGIRQNTPLDESVDVEPVDLLKRRARRRFRVAVPELPADARDQFDEVVQTLSPDAATAEADRCLDCDLLCSTCEWVCPNRAIVTYRISGAPIALPVPVVDPATGTVTTAERFEVVQRFQVAVLADLCNGCGNCDTFCPTSGRPHRDKPRLYLSRDDFDGQPDNATLLFREGSSWGARSWIAGALHEVVLEDVALRCTVGDLNLTLDPDTFTVLESRPTTRDGCPPDLRGCAALWILLRGIIDSLPWLPVAELDERTPSEPMNPPTG